VVVNGKAFEAFATERGVRQGCPLAPYLFLIVRETFNATVNEDLRDGKSRHIITYVLEAIGHCPICGQH
jgi:hypothetical protein